MSNEKKQKNVLTINAGYGIIFVAGNLSMSILNR